MGKQWGNAYRTTVVCVDSAEHGELHGRLYNPYWPEGKQFRGVMEFLLLMEELLDEIHFPQAFEATRTFRMAREPALAPPDAEKAEGKLVTFALRVLFRQNASWQGSVAWLEGKKEESFRSVLELLLLMNSVLEKPANDAGKK